MKVGLEVGVGVGVRGHTVIVCSLNRILPIVVHQ